MTIKELKEELECFDEELEIRIAEQPNYPFEYSILSIKDFKDKVYLIEGEQIKSISKEVFD